MQMEDKESTESGSPGGGSEIDSPPETINTTVHFSMENNPGVSASPAVAASGGGAGGGELVAGKKKRGRPRKYDSEGNLRPGYVRKVRPPPAAAEFTMSTPSSYEFAAGGKRSRGRGSGSGNWKALASLGELFTNTAGGDFTPHVITVYTGEDVAGKILTFAQKGSRGVCVLSANGSVSNVTIRQPGSSGGLLTYEGRFEILTLTGSYTISDTGGIRSRTGGLSVSLASSDGRVIGGGVAGLLMAAAPIQIVIGSFEPNGFKTNKRKPHSEPRTSPSYNFSPATVTAAIPISQAAPAVNDVYPMSRFAVQSQGEAYNNSSNKEYYPNNSASTDTSDWNGSGPGSDLQRPSPDINVSIPVQDH